MTSIAARPLGLEDPTTLSDAEVIARVLAGERKLYEVLIRRYNPRVFRVARAILLSEAEAEDAMQDAYVQAFMHLARFEGRSSFATWLTRIAVNAALARRRRTRSETYVDDLDGLDLPPSAHPLSSQAMAKNPEHHADDRELRVAVEASLDALPAHYRTVFVLRAIEDMSVPETAECLGIPDETVRTRFFRARSALKEALRERDEATARHAYELHLSRCDRVVQGVFARIAAGLDPHGPVE